MEDKAARRWAIERDHASEHKQRIRELRFELRKSEAAAWMVRKKMAGGGMPRKDESAWMVGLRGWFESLDTAGVGLVDTSALIDAMVTLGLNRCVVRRRVAAESTNGKLDWLTFLGLVNTCFLASRDELFELLKEKKTTFPTNLAAYRRRVLLSALAAAYPATSGPLQPICMGSADRCREAMQWLIQDPTPNASEEPAAGDKAKAEVSVLKESRRLRKELQRKEQRWGRSEVLLKDFERGRPGTVMTWGSLLSGESVLNTPRSRQYRLGSAGRGSRHNGQLSSGNKERAATAMPRLRSGRPQGTTLPRREGKLLD
ncbi:unnamed protein product [Chrysoparadoxa australica]